MEKNMQVNFEFLERRIIDALENTDLDYIKYELSKLDDATIVSGVGGSSVVSQFAANILNKKNGIITINSEPRDFLYRNINCFKNVISCSYGGSNYGVELSLDNDLNKYLLSNNSFDRDDITYLKYNTTIDRERSFISLGATLIPISILYYYYLDKELECFIDENTDIFSNDYNFPLSDTYEIFTGYDTSVSSKYLESTLVESGLGIPIIHDKYSYCHGRSTLSINYNSTAIYFNRNTEFDKMMLTELPKYYKDIIVIDSLYDDQIKDDYNMLIKCMYLTKYIAKAKEKDLSKVEYSPIVKKLYKYNGAI